MLEWFKKVKTWLIVIGSICVSLGTAVSYIQIDTSSFEKTTNITFASANGQLYTRIKTEVELPAFSYIIVSINNHQVDHHVYHHGIQRGTIVMDTPLPFNVIKDKKLDVRAEIVYTGVRTLFSHEQIFRTDTIKQQGK